MQFWGQKVQIGGHFWHQNRTFRTFVSNYFRPFKIGKGWIASSFRPRKDRKWFRPNVLLKGSRRTSLTRLSPCRGSPIQTIPNQNTGHAKRVLYFGGDEGSRTPVQNGLKQVSTSVGIFCSTKSEKYRNR